jgi:hypothetical protein
VKNKIKIQAGHQNIARSLNFFPLPSLTCNFSRFEKKQVSNYWGLQSKPWARSRHFISVFFIASYIISIYRHHCIRCFLLSRWTGDHPHKSNGPNLARGEREDSGRNILDSCLVLTTYWNSFIL